MLLEICFRRKLTPNLYKGNFGFGLLQMGALLQRKKYIKIHFMAHLIMSYVPMMDTGVYCSCMGIYKKCDWVFSHKMEPKNHKKYRNTPI